VQGNNLIRNAKIKQGIAWLRDRDPVSILTPEQILTAWSKIAMSDLADPKDRMKALENLARSHAMFTDKQISLSYILEHTIRSLVQAGQITQDHLLLEHEDHSS
jgi:hypothetical protein